MGNYKCVGDPIPEEAKVNAAQEESKQATDQTNNEESKGGEE